MRLCSSLLQGSLPSFQFGLGLALCLLDRPACNSLHLPQMCAHIHTQRKANAEDAVHALEGSARWVQVGC